MLLGQRSRRMVAATLLTIFATNTFAPSISYALTSGPTQPEATSFEPVDTTDMVNLFTGSLAYNIPVLSVPGPEGGYPLALSYHAGIQPNEDASWVGLGWSLNPGAISRSVNGYPDEWAGVSNTSHAYWSGGITSTFTIGASVPLAGAAGISFGLSFSQDTYQGFGVGFSLGVYVGIPNTPLSVNAGVSVSPYGNPSVYVWIGASTGSGGGVNGSFGITFTSDLDGHNSLGFSAGLTYTQQNHNDPDNPAKVTSSNNFSLVGASIGTGGTKPSLSVGGFSAHVTSTDVAQVQTTSSGFNLAKFGLPISLGYNKTRYFIDQLTNVATFGSLQNYGWVTNGDNSLVDNQAFDTYSLLENPTDKNMIDYPDPSVLQGGAYDDFDLYTVVAQGLGGNIRPYKFLSQARGQNIKNADGSYRVKYYAANRPGSLPASDAMPEFRFVNDFSNSYRQGYPAYNTPDLSANPLGSLTVPFDPAPVYGNNDGNTGYDPTENILAGSRSITLGITVNPYRTLGYTTPVGNPMGTINGFTITNESGVKYTFGLPAYSFGEEVYQEKIDRTGGLSFNRQTKATPYAYTWYLTSITGPDYVDRNNDGMADDGDWGYWVNFEYGKWSSDYVWRNPSEGYNTDEDNGWKDCSVGHKEIYYLNAIRTRSHVALFEKEVRTDGRGESTSVFAKNGGGANQDYTYPGLFDNSSGASMKLTHIYLLNSKDENFVTPSSGTLNGNVLDASDVAAVGRTNLEAKALRVIDFNYDYSLCPNTSNSFYGPGVTQGKLTLNSVGTRGAGGVSVLPTTQFQYDLGADAVTQAGVTLSPTSFVTPNAQFKIGDMITCSSPAAYCGVISASSFNGTNWTYTLTNGNYTGPAVSATVSTTKNPPYNKDFFDIWGMYKSDANLTLIGQKANLYRKTTNTSSRGADAWSLRRIVSQLGSTIKIGYEPNNMQGTVINNDLPINTSTFASDQGTGSITQVKFQLNTAMPDYTFYNPPAAGTTGSIAVESFTTTPPNGNPHGGNLPHNVYSTSGLMGFTVTSVDGDGTIHATLSAAINHPVQSGFVGAILFFTNQLNFVGGGMRVNSISAQSSASSPLYTTSYNYNVPGSSQSSGVSSFSPSGLDLVASNFQMILLNLMSSVYSLSRELPPPGVMYEYVTATRQVKNPDESAPRSVEGSTLYHFEVFKPNMLGRVEVDPRQTGTYAGQTQYARYYSIDKFTSCIGNVKSVTQLDDHGNKLTQTVNHYLHDAISGEPLQNFMTDYKNLLAAPQYNYQGYLQERYGEVKAVDNQDLLTSDPTAGPDISSKATISAREEFPCIQTGQTVTNYVNGTQTSTTNLSYDYYSGAVTRTLETDGYGNAFVTQTVPAYTLAPYSSMGIKLNDGNNPAVFNSNMLTQTAESYKWKVDPNNTNTKLGLVYATVTTWGNGVTSMGPDGTTHIQDGRSEVISNVSYPNGNVWRMGSDYNWMYGGATTDGLTPLANFADFNFTTPAASDLSWKRSSSITLFDVYSKGLESKDINDLSGAARMGYNDAKVVLTGTGTNYYEMAYTGAEDEGVTQTNNVFVRAVNGVPVTGTAHTGSHSLLLPPSPTGKGFVYTVPTANLTPGRNYNIAVWAKASSVSGAYAQLYYTVNGVTTTSGIASNSAKSAGGWYLLNLPVPATAVASGTSLEVGCINNDPNHNIVYLDDFRFQPANASTTAYVYDSFTGQLTDMIDNSNLYTRFLYDAGGRLINTFKEKIGVGEIKATEYQYNMAACAFTNGSYINYYTKNNCNSGYTGSIVKYTVPGGRYCSGISSQDAFNQAQVDMNGNGQQNANNLGSCFIGGNIMTTAFGLNNSNPGELVAFDAATGTFMGNFVFFNGTSYFNLAMGTYNLEVIGLDNVSRTVTITGYGSQVGSNVTFNNVTIANSQLTINMQ